MNQQIKLRFAPSPTGNLHIGNVRAALFNMYFAKKNEGVFALRIEDTDTDRCKPEYVDGLMEKLTWLGVKWEGEVLRQSERFDRYQDCAQKLLDAGLAYECFETSEELDAINKDRMKQKLPPGYDGRAKNLTDDEKQKLRYEGREVTIRFATPNTGISTFTDLIRGEVSVDWAGVSDFVIMRSNGTPTFFLANAVDDADSHVTHAFRGEDLLDSTHRIIALRKALAEIGSIDEAYSNQNYAHMPLILSADRAKLSKRHGAVGIDDLRELGYLAKALVNYISLLGWSHPEQKEIVTVDEIVEHFYVDRINSSAAIFDTKKLDWINGEYIRAMDEDELLKEVTNFCKFIGNENFINLDEETQKTVIRLAHDRAVTLKEIIDQAEFLSQKNSEITYDEAAWEKLVKTDQVATTLTAIKDYLSNCEWTLEGVDLRPVCNELEVKPRKALPPVYTALQGSDRGLPLFESILLLGREDVVARLDAVIKKL